jgi:hypothetical protein
LAQERYRFKESPVSLIYRKFAKKANEIKGPHLVTAQTWLTHPIRVGRSPL